MHQSEDEIHESLDDKTQDGYRQVMASANFSRKREAELPIFPKEAGA